MHKRDRVLAAREELDRPSRRTLSRIGAPPGKVGNVRNRYSTL
jgi:hypothetical protein